MAIAVGAEPVPVQGHDHASLALLPFGISGEERRQKPVTIAYQAHVDGKMRRVNVTIRPGAEVGLPTPGDQIVFLALIQLAMRRDEQTQRLSFARSELIDVLQWSDGGRNFDRLRESLDRLASVLITVNSALVSRDGREYNRRAEATGLIDGYSIESRRGAACYIEWGQIVRDGFHLGDFKTLNWDLCLALANPTATQLYRLLDRVVLSGEQTWEIGWRPLAQALGLSPDSYSRPARFRQVLDPHIDALIEHGIVDSVDYERGGKFRFHLRNYLRSQLRRVLHALGCYDEAARQLVAGHDEVDILIQCDQLQHGAHPTPEKPGGWLTQAIREGYPLRYPPDERETFTALWEMLSPAERTAYHRAGLKLCSVREDLFATRPDPSAWPQELRSVIRCLVSHGIDPEQV